MGGRGSGPTPRYSGEQIAAALRTAEGKPRVAAKLLGCHRATVWRYQQRLAQEAEQAADDAELLLMEGEVAGWMESQAAALADEVQRLGQGVAQIRKERA